LLRFSFRHFTDDHASRPNCVNFRLCRAFDRNRRLALTAQKLRNLPSSHCECQPCCHSKMLRVNRYVPLGLAERAQSRWSAAERAIPLRHTASHTIEKRFTRAVDWFALSHSVMICAPAAGRPAFRVGAWDRNGREHSEDGADDGNPQRQTRSLCRMLQRTAQSPAAQPYQNFVHEALGCDENADTT